MRHFNIAVFCLFVSVILILTSCGKNHSPEEISYIEEVNKYRSEKDEYMKNDSSSPFNFKGKVKFEPLSYYEPDPAFVFKSKLYEYQTKDTITIFGTKGEERQVIRYGYVVVNYNKEKFKVNVYKGISRTGEEYYSIWFTDKTTGNETYGVGRYLDFEYNEDPEHVYTIDFNEAYNPYCAYTKLYTCPVPRKEDYIDMSIEAGEKNYH